MNNTNEADATSLADKNYKPTLHEVDKILDANIVGEEETRLGLFVSWILARKYVVITGSSRSGKCVSSDTQILFKNDGVLCMSTPDNIPLNHEIATLTPNGIEYHRPDAIIYNGRKEVFEVTTKLGYAVKVTSNHPFLIDYFPSDHDIGSWRSIDSGLRKGTLITIRHHEEIMMDEIKEINAVGFEDTYDISMPSYHNFIGNDIILHNTWVKEQVKNLIQEQCYQVKTGSDKSAWYEAEQIQNKFYVDVPELNQVPKDFIEILKCWGEDKPATYKVVGIDLQTGKRKNEEKYLPYRPFVFAIADENELNIPKELRYRLIEIRCDGSESQTRRILKWQAEYSKNPRLHKQINQTSLKEVKNHLITMPPFKKYHYINPMADMVEERTPAMFTDARTAHQIFRDVISGIQRFHWKESMMKEVKGYKKPLLFISPQTILQAYIILGKIFLNSSLKCNDLQRKILDIIKKSRTYMEASTVSKELKKMGTTITRKLAHKHLEDLTEMNYLDKKESGRQVFYEISGEFQKQRLHVEGKDLMNMAKKTMLEQFPGLAQEYEETYLTNPTFIHPFKGETLDLNTYATDWDENKTKNMENLDNYVPPSDQEEAQEDQDRFSGTDITESMEDTPNFSDDDLVVFIKEKGEYDTNKFTELYGEDTLQRLIDKGLVFKPNPNTIKVLE